MYIQRGWKLNLKIWRNIDYIFEKLQMYIILFWDSTVFKFLIYIIDIFQVIKNVFQFSRSSMVEQKLYKTLIL